MILRNRLAVRTVWLVAGALGMGILVACATTGSESTPDDPSGTLQGPDGGIDGDAAVDDADAPDASCDDCEYFPDTCEADTLCSIGPFEPKMPGGAFEARTRVNVIRGRSASDVWVAGSVGAIAHFDGTSWALSSSGTGDTLSALWLPDGMEMTFGQPYHLFTRGVEIPDAGVSAGGWSSQATASITPAYNDGQMPQSFEYAWAGPGAEWLWLATRSTDLVRPFGGLWRLHRSTTPASFELMPGVDPGMFPFGGGLTGIHGNSADVIWAVGDNGAAARVTGAEGDQPASQFFNTQTWNALRAVWAASDSEAWAVGGYGTIRHYGGSGSIWDIVADVPTTQHLNAVWGTSSSDIWAVGDAGVVLHYDGTEWSRVKIAGLGPRRPDLYSVWTASPGHVWIGGHGVFFSLGGKP